MVVKQLEIRDRATFIPMLAIQLSKADGYLVSRAGFGETPLVVLINLVKMKCSYSPFNWEMDTRTLPVAHNWIEKHWNEIGDQAVIDVEFILGESQTKKTSERFMRGMENGL